MADQLYTITYKRTNLTNRSLSQGNITGSKLCSLSNFVASGDGAEKRIKQAVSVTFKHYYTISHGSGQWTSTPEIRAVLVTQHGEKYGTYHNIYSSGTNFTDTFKDVTAAQANSITGIRLEWKTFTSNTNIYYQATSAHPQVLTITFYAEEGAHYYTGGEWKDAEIYVRQGDAWKQATPYCYANGQFVQTE